MIKLYHYVHCPFCIRVRMALGFLDIEFESIVLGYDDEKTPIELAGTKMLPIIVEEKTNTILNESLDIIRFLDINNTLKSAEKLSDDFDSLLSLLGSPIHNLCMPYWIYTKEFTPSARKYFQTKKEKKRGPFNLLIQEKEKHLSQLERLLEELEKNFKPFYQSNSFSIVDICLASHLWGLYIFPEFQFSASTHKYLQEVKKKCHFNYHEDFWLKNNDFI